MKNSSSVLITSIILGILLIGGFIIFGQRTKSETLTLPIRVEEYADFQCPACKSFSPTIEQIKDIEGVEFTFKHFPLTKIHERAYEAAVAAEAAREQGKFYEYYAILYANQPTPTQPDTFEDEDLLDYAKEIGLDVEQFETDYTSNQTLKDRVDADIKEGESIGINSTPTLIVNGERFTIVGKDTEQIISEIEAMVAKAQENMQQQDGVGDESTNVEEESITTEDEENTPSEIDEGEEVEQTSPIPTENN